MGSLEYGGARGGAAHASAARHVSREQWCRTSLLAARSASTCSESRTRIAPRDAAPPTRTCCSEAPRVAALRAHAFAGMTPTGNRVDFSARCRSIGTEPVKCPVSLQRCVIRCGVDLRGRIGADGSCGRLWPWPRHTRAPIESSVSGPAEPMTRHATPCPPRRNGRSRRGVIALPSRISTPLTITAFVVRSQERAAHDLADVSMPRASRGAQTGHALGMP